MSSIRYICSYQSPLGPMTMATDGEALTGLWFDGQKYDRANLKGKEVKEISGTESETFSVFVETRRWLDIYFGKVNTEKESSFGRESVFSKEPASDKESAFSKEFTSGKESVFSKETASDKESALSIDSSFNIESAREPDFTPPLRIEGSEFRQLVAEIMLTIPYGQTMTYGEIAKEAAERMGKKSMSAQAVGGAVGHNSISLIIPCHRVMGANGSFTGYAGGIEKKMRLLEMESGKKLGSEK